MKDTYNFYSNNPRKRRQQEGRLAVALARLFPLSIRTLQAKDLETLAFLRSIRSADTFHIVLGLTKGLRNKAVKRLPE